MNISYAIQSLAPYVTQLTSVSLAYTNTLRGVYVDSIGEGILLKRDGTCRVGSLGTTLTITLEGGLAGWEGALVNNDVGNYESPAQTNNLANLITYITSRNNQCSINLNR